MRRVRVAGALGPGALVLAAGCQILAGVDDSKAHGPGGVLLSGSFKRPLAFTCDCRAEPASELDALLVELSSK
jgi:hypothetical protein